ncbi:hypothetical protein ACFVXE_08185 [Streptomyces sp. NPDC058231]|uniref:hypothetical protein n=1 Tax=Streptomyces sp. NPDC058231 TaxID=3346392 RepID=UPI0036EBBF84
MSALRPRRLVTAATALILALGGVVAATGTAQAAANGTQSGDGWEQITYYASAGGRCEAVISYENSYALGLYINAGVAVGCTFWIERSADGGYTWPSVYYTHALGPNDSSYSTGSVLDSSAYVARVCFHFNVSGAARHCSLLI